MAMFDQTFVDGEGKTHKGWTVILSFAFQFLLTGILILIPLIYTDVLPQAQLTSMLTAPPPPPPPPPPPTPVVKIKVAPRQFDAGRLMAPREVPKNVAIIVEDPNASLPSASQVQGIPGGIPGGLGGLGGIGVAPPPPPPPPVKVVPTQTGPLRVGGQVQAANLIKKVTPAYPTLAKSARIQGTVRFTAIIGKDGTIQNLQLVSGHPMLVASATEAVKQWIYKPTLLNGEAVEVITQIDVNFTLSQ